MSTVTEEKLMTIEEFVQLPHDGLLMELVLGKVIKMNLPYPYHGFVAGNIALLVGTFAKTNQLARMWTGDSGIITHRNPDTLRGADVAFISYRRLPAYSCPFPQGRYLDVVPDLVFEVLSPSDRWADVLEKMAEYLTAGVTVVCLVDPKSLTVMVYRGDGIAPDLR